MGYGGKLGLTVADERSIGAIRYASAVPAVGRRSGRARLGI
jgi:hypothetical protein